MKHSELAGAYYLSGRYQHSDKQAWRVYNISIRMMFINCWPVLNQRQGPKEPSHALTPTLGRALGGEKAEEERKRSTRSLVTLEPKQMPEWLQGLDKASVTKRLGTEEEKQGHQLFSRIRKSPDSPAKA